MSIAFHGRLDAFGVDTCINMYTINHIRIDAPCAGGTKA